MTSRARFETILRDDNDMSGQTIRQWCIEAETGRIAIRTSADGGSYILGLRPEDVTAFIQDLNRARAFASEAKPREPLLSQEEISALTRDPDPDPSARQT